MGRCALVLTAACLLACGRHTYRTLVVEVADGQGRVALARVFVNGAPVGVTGPDGTVRVSGRWYAGSPIELAVRLENPLAPQLPTVAKAQTPNPWFTLDEQFQVSVRLRRVEEIPSVGALPAEPASPPAALGLLEGSRPSARVLEEELPPESTPTPVASPVVILNDGNVPPITVPEANAGTPTPQPNLVAEALQLPAAAGESAALQVEAFDGGNAPLAGAQVFLGRQEVRQLLPIGTTGADGRLLASLPLFLRGETVLVRHPCCVPRHVPLAFSGASGNVRVHLGTGQGRDLALRHFAYGAARGLAKSELRAGGRLVDVSSPLGVVIASGLAGLAEFGSREGVPASLPLSLDGLPPSAVWYVGAREPARPAVGFWELADPQGEGGPWRRFRREMMVQVMRSAAIRPVVSTQVARMAQGAGLTPDRILQEGWAGSVLNSELDLLLTLKAPADGSSIALTLLNRTGTRLAEEQVPLDSTRPPEVLARALFERLLARIPAEATVTEVTGSRLRINLGIRNGWNLTAGQRFTIMGFDGEKWRTPPETPLATAIVRSVDEAASELEVENPQTVRLTELEAGLRAVRLFAEEMASR